ncbi:hypothetical protein JW992_09035 [candidate division KSB1 bacterium]|nr:hypothetical protein [candidate division KSB1 bacterium]
MKKIAILIFLAGTVPAMSQMLRMPLNPTSLMTTEIAEINAWRSNANPAFLLLDPAPETLTLRSQFQQSEGDFRAFLTPERVQILQQSASGKKQIGDNQIFSGAFGFQKEIRGNWEWIASKETGIGNPFLIGDSTSGDTHYDGIVMNAAYARRLGSAFLIGTEIDYFVDEGLKKVSPKPRSQHRDIRVTAGMGWLASRRMQIGLQATLVDRKEEISYSEDKESIERETILFKFRGFDYPQVLIKKSETRFSEHRTYRGAGSITWTPAKTAVLLTAGGWELEEMAVSDNLLTPLEEGYWQAERLYATLEAGWEVTEKHGVRLRTAWSERQLWARHPFYRVRLQESRQKGAEAVLAWRFTRSALCLLSVEGGWKQSEPRIQDYYSNILLDTHSSGWMMRIGWRRIWSVNLVTAFRLGQEELRNNNPIYHAASGSGWFADFRAADLLYLISDCRRTWGQLVVEFTPTGGGTLALQTTAIYSEPRGSATYTGQHRFDIDINVCYSLPIR